MDCTVGKRGNDARNFRKMQAAVLIHFSHAD